MARRYYSTTAQRTTLASSCTDSATTIVVTAATGFPSSTPFPLTLDADTVNEEAVLVTSRVGTTCTVTRAYDGTTGVAHSAGATVRHTALALDFNEASEHVFEATTAHGLTLADVITTSNTKTLTNKTLTAPTIADFTNAAHDHGDADDGGTLPASSVLNRPINDQSGTGGSAYTFALADARKHVLASGGSTKTFTIPLQAAVTWLADAKIVVTNTGAGVLTIAITATGTLNGSDLTLAQGESAALLRTASDVWWCLPFSSASGAVPRGTISGTTGSPSTSSNGGATAYKWSTAGDYTFTVDVAGVFDYLIVGAGGSGAFRTNGGPGGGGGGTVLYVQSAYFAAGSHTVKVGAGGAGHSSSQGQDGGYSAIDSIVAAGGGGGGWGSDGTAGNRGGNGGGGGTLDATSSAGGAAFFSGIGYAGGAVAHTRKGAGGGGAGAVGGATASGVAGAGGAGVSNSITGSAVTYGAGGGGAGQSDTQGAAGGTGATAGVNSGSSTAGTAGTGGGSGGCAGAGAAGAGGSGTVILLVGTV